MVSVESLLIWYLVGIFTGVIISIIVILTYESVEDEGDRK